MAELPDYSTETIVFTSDTRRNVSTDQLIQDIEIKTSIEVFEYMNNISLEVEDVSLFELSENDSRRAYKIAKAALLRLASSKLKASYFNNVEVASTEDTSQSDLAKINETLLNILPDEDVTEFDIILSVYPTKDDKWIFDFEDDTTSHLVSMHVTPPNLA
jgi:hypothetical protein